MSRIDEYRVHREELEVIFSEREKDRREPLIDLNGVEFETTADREIPMLPLGPLVEAYGKLDKNDTPTGWKTNSARRRDEPIGKVEIL